MKRSKIGHLTGIICVLLLVLLAAVAVYLDSQSPEPILPIFQTDPPQTTADTTEPEIPTDDGEEEQVTAPPTDLPATVVIPSGNTEGLSFPCQVPGYGLVIEKLAPYSGMFVEDGTNVQVDQVAMLLVENQGDYPVEYTQIRVEYGKEALLFDVSALPVGQRVVVQEKTCKAVPAGQPTAATAMVVQRAAMEMSEDQVQVTDNGDNTLTIRNLTDKMIPTVRVFYKYYMEDEETFVGGIAFAVRVTRLAPGASVVIQPSHYTSQTSRVVMVLTYDKEV